MLVDLLGVVHVVQRLRVEHIVLIFVLVLFLASLLLLLISVACSCLPMHLLHVCYLRISDVVAPRLGHPIVDLRGGERGVAVRGGGALSRRLRLCALSAYLPLKQHSVYHLLYLIGMLTRSVPCGSGTGTRLALQS